MEYARIIIDFPLHGKALEEMQPKFVDAISAVAELETEGEALITCYSIPASEFGQ